MKITSILSIAIFATTILGAPQLEHGLVKSRQRGGRRNGNPSRSTNLATRVPTFTLSENWAGAIYRTPPQGTTFTSVQGTMTIPRSYDTADSRVSFWVGIDGDGSEPVIQTGFDLFFIEGETTYTAWQEWSPDPLEDIDSDEFLVSSGDVITFNVTLSADKASASVLLINTSTNQQYPGKIEAPDAAHNALGQSVEWIVERVPLSDDSSGDGYYPLTNWGSVSFTDCIANTSDGKRIDLTNAGLITMVSSLEDDNPTDLAYAGFPDDTTSEVRFDWQASG